MARSKTITKSKVSGLVLYLLCQCIMAAHAVESNLGKVTQLQGEVTFLEFTPPHRLSVINKGSSIQTEGSFLTREDSHFTIQLFDGSWLKISPRTKFSLEFNPESKSLIVYLFSGSLKMLFSTKLNANKLAKVIVLSSDAVFETIEAKMSIVRNTITSETSLFVEKGLVSANLRSRSQDQSILVHKNETTSLKDREEQFQTPRNMSAKEIKFLDSKFYLGGKSKELD